MCPCLHYRLTKPLPCPTNVNYPKPTFAFPGTPPLISCARSNSLLAVPNDGPNPDASSQPHKHRNVGNPPKLHSPIISLQQGKFKFSFLSQLLKLTMPHIRLLLCTQARYDK